MQFYKITCFYCLFCLMGISLFSQEPAMIHRGQITFEKRVNAYALLDEYYSGDNNNNNSFAQQYRSIKPQFGISHFVLYFNDDSSLYRPDKSAVNVPEVSLLSTNNIVFSDMKHQISVTKKEVIDETFLVSDSIRKIQWKLTDEIREIAGFTCRRANAVILDSIYVVAFYSDQIVPKAGPESFSGLPGMILGVILPHQHISWFATGFSLKGIDGVSIARPFGGTNVDHISLFKHLADKPAIRSNGKSGVLMLLNFML